MELSFSLPISTNLHKIALLARGRMTSEQHTILMVEDEPLIRLSVSEHLEACGFHVLQAATAAEAVRILVSRRDVALVFTDVRMPGDADGLQLARFILQNYPNILVMITSGEAGMLEGANQLCGMEAIGKPYQPEVLARRMQQILQARKSSSRDD